MSKSSRKKPLSPVKQNPLAKPVDGLNTTLSRSIPSSEKLSVGPEQTSLVQPISSLQGQGPELIRFDKRVKITLAVFIGLFLFMVMSKLHFGSVAMWNRMLPDGSPENRGIVAGTARQIRMDEYAVSTPWNISNYHNGLQVENEAVGGLKTPLLIMPVKHISIIFKFSHWGMLFLDVERGYVWMMCGSMLVLLFCSFLFFLLLTRNQYWLSLTGAVTLLFSSGTASWSFAPTSIIGFCCIAFVLAVYLLISTKFKLILLYSTLLIWVIVNFAFSLYPPYQVPMVHFFGLIFIGYLINERQQLFPVKAIPTKLIGLSLAAAFASMILYFFKQDGQETVTAVMNTVYPGKRAETGGTGFIANWYSEYYSWFFTDTKFPKSWLNSCEMAHYLNFFPVVGVMCIATWALTKRINWVLLMASIFIVFMLIWMEIGFPKEVANLTLMSMSPTRRAQIPMGAGGIIMLFIYLGSLKFTNIRSMPAWFTPVAIVGICAFMVYTAYVNINDTDGLIKAYQTFIPVVFFIGMNTLLIFSLKIPYRIPIFCIGILLYLIPNMRLNPLSVGLSPIIDHALYKAIRPMVESDPEARWMVNGNQFITYMVTATGAKQITGVKFIPDRKQIVSI